MLTTLTDIARELRQTGAVNEAERLVDAAAAEDLLSYLDFVVARIEETSMQYFAPRQARVYEDAYRVKEGGRIQGNKLYLTYALQQVLAIDNDGLLLPPEAYTLLPRSGPPYSAIRLTDALVWGYQASTDPEACIGIEGIWVQGGVWVDSLQTLSTNLSREAKSLNVTDADAPDARFGPAFSVGQLLRVEDEFMQVRGIDGHTLSLLRGANGTTATAHAPGSTIESWYPDEQIRRAATRWGRG